MRAYPRVPEVRDAAKVAMLDARKFDWATTCLMIGFTCDAFETDFDVEAGGAIERCNGVGDCIACRQARNASLWNDDATEGRRS